MRGNTAWKVLAVVVILILIGVLIYFLVDAYWPYTPPPEITGLKSQLALVDPRFANFDIREHTRESYTRRKTRIYMCLRDPVTRQVYDHNVLIYVALHECAHVICVGVEHDDEFIRAFEGLLARAASLGLYDPNIPFPKRYCGKDM